MGNARTNSLHERLDAQTRRAVERDLVEQPPGRETYAKVHEYHRLGEKEISIKAVERYGGYLRAMARNQWIAELADSVVGRDLGPDITGVIRSRLMEALVTGETTIASLMKAAITEKSLTERTIRAEEWEAKREIARRALDESEKAAKKDPAQAMETLREAVQMIYGVEVKA